MAARKTGLGKGLDGLFPSYMEKPAQKEKKTGKKDKSTSKSVPKPVKATEISFDEVKEEVSESTENKEKSVVEIKEKAETAKSAVNTRNTINKENTDNKKSASETKKKADEAATVSNGESVNIDINRIEPNRNQPRSTFDEDNLNELAESIKMYGIISPIIATNKGDYYEIIAGERRWRAARIAGLKEVPVIIRDYDEQKVLEISLIENIQREDLNAIEEALAFKRLSDEFSLTQDEVSARVSKSRSAITNSLRLLKLDPRVQEMVKDEKISGGHARALLAISDPDRQFEMAVHVFDEKLSVREVEKLIKTLSSKPKEKKTPVQNTAMDIICREMEDRMKSVLGTKVSVTRKNEKRGKIEIEYYSQEELERIYELLSSLS